MEEDVIGTMRTIGTSPYVTCARCSRMARRDEATIVPSDAREGFSEYQYLCATCVAELAAGEQDLTPPEP
jgi:DNA-directed RNA polymerase subunit RPC12/RpoP